MTTESTATPAATGDIVARAGTYYRNTRYIMAILLVGMGCWFAYDGWVRYPRVNAIIAHLDAQLNDAVARGDAAEQGRIQTELKNYEFHNDAGLLFQRALGFVLPPLGVLVLWYSLHKSRGEYRLSGTKLSVPGHPTIDLDDIKSVNNDLWDRKGIVWLKYESGGQQGEIMLDDFLYQRPPTDAIYDRIAEKFGLNEDDAENESDDADSDDDADAS